MASVLLIVAAPGTLNADDTRLQSLLTGDGHSVTLHDDNTALPASGYDVLVYAESVSGSGTAVTEANATTYPLIYCDTHSNTRLSMSSTDGTSNTASQYDITTAGNSHPITSGLSDPATVYSTSGTAYATTGTIPSGVTVLATNNGQPTQAAVLIAEAGGTNSAGGTFPARRVSLLGAAGAGQISGRWTTDFDTIFLNAVTWAIGSTAHNVDVGQATETDSAQTARAFKQKEFALPITAQLTASGTPVGRTTETDAALAITPTITRRYIAVGQTAETDAANSATPTITRRYVAVGQTAETEAGQAVAHSKAAAVGQAVESDGAQPVGSAATLGLPTETDAALAITPRKTVLVGQAAESETGHAVTTSKATPAAAAAETDTAHRVLPDLRLPTETDIAFPTGRRKLVAVGRAGAKGLVG